jgi:hypothetical protein
MSTDQHLHKICLRPLKDMALHGASFLSLCQYNRSLRSPPELTCVAWLKAKLEELSTS